jgi:molecular chaperone GrpE (heat shock protein)
MPNRPLEREQIKEDTAMEIQIPKSHMSGPSQGHATDVSSTSPARTRASNPSGVEDLQQAGMKRVGFWETLFRADLMSVQERLDRLEAGHQQLSDCLNRVDATLCEVGKKVGVLAQKNAALENASAQLARQNDQFYEKNVIEPLVRSILPVYDMVESARESVACRKSEEGIGWLKYLEAQKVMLEEFLAAYGVEPFRHEVGTRFDEQQMQPLKQVVVFERSLHFTVHESCQSGFRKGQRVIRPERILLNVCKGCGVGPATAHADKPANTGNNRRA